MFRGKEFQTCAAHHHASSVACWGLYAQYAAMQTLVVATLIPFSPSDNL